jgi:hypothetical protein
MSEFDHPFPQKPGSKSRSKFNLDLSQGLTLISKMLWKIHQYINKDMISQATLKFTVHKSAKSGL